MPSTHLLQTQIMLCDKEMEFMTEKALASWRCEGCSEEGVLRGQWNGER